MASRGAGVESDVLRCSEIAIDKSESRGSSQSVHASTSASLGTRTLGPGTQATGKQSCATQRMDTLMDFS
jgi:hypothetical protein